MKPDTLTETKHHKSYPLLSMEQTPERRSKIATGKRMLSSIAILLLFRFCGCSSFVAVGEGEAEAQYTFFAKIGGRSLL